ncbi:MAG: family 20 glycosylhydrolase [Bacilli bacterium]|nr:family 20 glycosylhydrolase [Bacilli bacterium]
MSVFPVPKKVIRADGFFETSELMKVFSELESLFVYEELKTFVNFEKAAKEDAQLKYLLDNELAEQDYKIVVEDKTITIYASSAVGHFYGTTTLKQIFDKSIQCQTIIDGPDLKVRGFMYDISRNKVPKVETVKLIIDVMAKLKMNHLELYVEGFSFGYKSFPEYLHKDGYLSIEEYQEIEAYANSKFIDFVPNMNGFGHMNAWLAIPELKHLGETETGMYKWGKFRKPSTLNALDPESIELVKKMYADMIPYMKSQYFNMNFDEPFELGLEKTKEAVEQYGEEKVYIDYMLKAYEEIKKYGKTPIIWGDVLINHDNALPLIPKDMIFAEWGYEAEHPFKDHLKKLSKEGIKFLAAPGTSTWNTIAGRKDDAYENILNACYYTKEYGGEGILLTDWGDNGHLQPLPISLPYLAYAGLLSYRCNEGAFKKVRKFVNKEIFDDSSGMIADLILELGNYYHFENDYVGNATHSFHVITQSVNALDQEEEDRVDYVIKRMHGKELTIEKYNAIMDFYDAKHNQLLDCDVDNLVKDELAFAIHLLKTLATFLLAVNDIYDNKFRIKRFKEVLKQKDILIGTLEYIWLERNKYSELEDSIQKITSVMTMCEEFIGRLK